MFTVHPNFKTVDGVTYDVLTFGLGAKACFPMKLPVGFEALVAPVRNYLSAHPEHPNQDTFSIELLLPDALSQAYPCPTSLGQ
jgi:hypothetical protein